MVKEKNIRSYISIRKDTFQLFNHFNNVILNEHLGYELMFVNFEEIWSNLDIVLEYIACKKHKKKFPSYKKRKGDDLLSENEDEKLKLIYEEMNEPLKKLPSIYINEDSFN